MRHVVSCAPFYSVRSASVAKPCGLSPPRPRLVKRRETSLARGIAGDFPTAYVGERETPCQQKGGEGIAGERFFVLPLVSR